MTESARLEELCEIVVGRTPSRAEQRYWVGDHRWLSIADMTGQPEIRTTKETLSDAGALLLGNRLAAPGTVLLSFKLSIGKVSIARVPVFTNEAIAALPVRDPLRLDPDYLAHYLKSADLTSGADRAAMGNTLNLAKLRAIEIPTPPLPEQRRIASILDQANAVVESHLEFSRSTDELATSLFLGRFGRAREWAARWSVTPLGSLAECRLGKMLDKARQTGSDRWPYVRNANVQWMRFELDDLLQMDFDERDRVEFSLRMGDVLVCEGGEPGRSAVWNGEMQDVYFQKALHRVRLNQETMLPAFFAWTMREMATSGVLAESITSATIAHLTGIKLKSLGVPVPPLDEQLSFVHELEFVNGISEKSGDSVRAARALAKALQDRAFRGEL